MSSYSLKKEQNIISKVIPFLMFQGNAEEAMNYYTSMIDESEITSITPYGTNEAGEEGSVMYATFSLKGHKFMCIDSTIKHEFTFTPSLSIYITCDTEEEINHLYEKLFEASATLMPLADYYFSKKFGLLISSVFHGNSLYLTKIVERSADMVLLFVFILIFVETHF